VEGSAAAKEEHPDHEPGPQVWVFEVDGVTYRYEHPFITGGEIMDLAGIPRDQGLVLIHDDGSQEAVPADERVHLVPAPVFRKRPRFKRG
jgi:hypothetical protein